MLFSLPPDGFSLLSHSGTLFRSIVYVCLLEAESCHLPCRAWNSQRSTYPLGLKACPTMLSSCLLSKSVLSCLSKHNLCQLDVILSSAI